MEHCGGVSLLCVHDWYHVNFSTWSCGQLELWMIIILHWSMKYLSVTICWSHHMLQRWCDIYIGYIRMLGWMSEWSQPYQHCDTCTTSCAHLHHAVNSPSRCHENISGRACVTSAYARASSSSSSSCILLLNVCWNECCCVYRFHMLRHEASCNGFGLHYFIAVNCGTDSDLGIVSCRYEWTMCVCMWWLCWCVCVLFDWFFIWQVDCEELNLSRQFCIHLPSTNHLISRWLVCMCGCVVMVCDIWHRLMLFQPRYSSWTRTWSQLSNNISNQHQDQHH